MGKLWGFKKEATNMYKIIALMMSLSLGLIFIGTPTSARADDTDYQRGNTETTVISSVTYVDPETGKTVVKYDDDFSTPDTEGTYSGGWPLSITYQRIYVGCRKVSMTNKVYNVSHTSVLTTFKTDLYWCFNTYKKTVSSITKGVDTDTNCCWIEDKGLFWDDGRFYDWATGTAPKSGYDDDRKWHFVQSLPKMPDNHWYQRNIIRGHSDGSWSARMEESG